MVMPVVLSYETIWGSTAPAELQRAQAMAAARIEVQNFFFI